MNVRLGHVLFGVAAIIAALLCVGLIASVVTLQALFPSVPHYTSPIAAQADSGASRISVPFCDPNPRLCEGYIRFYRDGRLLIYQDYEGMLAVDPETGRELWRASGEFAANNGLYLVEFDNGAYAYAPSSGKIVDLDDGRVVVQNCGMGEEQPRRTRNGLYRIECNRAVVLVDLQAGRIEPYASPNSADGETAIPPWSSTFDPGWHGPIEQTDDGELALWILTANSTSVALRHRERGEVWRVEVPYAPLSARIDAARLRVLMRVNGEDITYDMRDGRELRRDAMQPESRDDAPDDAGEVRIYDYTPSSERAPGEWHDLDVRASEDSSIVAHYQVQTPARGLRSHRGGHWGGDSLEGGARRLIVVRRADGSILLERAMESGPTATGGFRTDLALTADGRRVALLPTDGVLRIYEVPSPN